MQKAKSRDILLVSNILRGNKNILWEYYKTYTPILKRFIGKKIKDERDTDEILQNTLIASLDALRDYAGDSNLKTYLCAIAKNKVSDFYRKRRIKTLLFSNFKAFDSIFQVLNASEDELDRLITKDRVHEILHLLRPNYRQALKLRYLFELPVSKVAIKLKVSTKGAESILFRARREFAFNYVKKGYFVPTASKEAGRSFRISYSKSGILNQRI